MKYINTFEATINKRGYNSFIQTVKRGSSKAVLDAIKKGEDPNQRDSREMNRTGLMFAANNLIMVVDVLLKAGADPNLQDNDGRTALMFATTKSIRKKLLDFGADPNITSIEGYNAAMDLFYFNALDVETLKMFINKGLNLDYKNNKSETLYSLVREEVERKINRFNIGLSKTNDIPKDLQDLLDYLHEFYPEYKDEYDLKRNIGKFNV